MLIWLHWKRMLLSKSAYFARVALLRYTKASVCPNTGSLAAVDAFTIGLQFHLDIFGALTGPNKPVEDAEARCESRVYVAEHCQEHKNGRTKAEQESEKSDDTRRGERE